MVKRNICKKKLKKNGGKMLKNKSKWNVYIEIKWKFFYSKGILDHPRSSHPLILIQMVCYAYMLVCGDGLVKL